MECLLLVLIFLGKYFGICVIEIFAVRLISVVFGEEVLDGK